MNNTKPYSELFYIYTCAMLKTRDS